MGEALEMPVEDVVDLDLPASLPLMPIRDLVLFPRMTAPLLVSRELSARALEAAVSQSGEQVVMVAAQRTSTTDEPKPEHVHDVGTVARIVRSRPLSDGRVRVLVQGLFRALVRTFEQDRPYLRVSVERLDDAPILPELCMEVEALVRTVRDQVERYTILCSGTGKAVPAELSFAVGAADEPGRLADLIASLVLASASLKVPEAQVLLERVDPLERLRATSDLLRREIGILELRSRIEIRAREEMSKSHRELYLREQIRAIRYELGERDGRGLELDMLKSRIGAIGLPREVVAEAEQQLRRLELMAPDTAEAAGLRTWLDWLSELPWSTASKDQLDLKAARRVLDEDHYNLREVKDRILEYLAVRKLNGASRGPILCLMGPPGVGKTSLGRSIARALDRRFVCASLGGVRDEGEIRGHRRTYVGAMPGRILMGMKQAGTVNPVFMLDELDKMGTECRGDPQAALLEVLDPEQNHGFRDHYLGLPYDLSRVLFLATANHIDAVMPALRDRFEVLSLPGYTGLEKLRITERFLLPRQLEAAGLRPEGLVFTRAALRTIIGEYTREAGLRDLERAIARIARKQARRVAEGEGDQRADDKAVRITRGRLQRWLGHPPFPASSEDGSEAVGIATGLAWTPWGGEILTVEAQLMCGKGTLTLTGQLGDVMRESATAALSFVRARARDLGLDETFFGDREIHIHVPAGAVPKDGPSAGSTIAVALMSLLGHVPVRSDVAMTGEITLRGRLLRVGGLKEKLLAAARQTRIGTVLIPDGNAAELGAVPRHLRERLHLIPVRTLDEVFALALVTPLTRSPAPPREPAPKPEAEGRDAALRS